jgi:hypothetical protein
MGAGKALCFECTEEVVKEHAADIAAFRKQVDTERKFIIAGAIIGAIFGVIMAINQYPAMALLWAIQVAGIVSVFGFFRKLVFLGMSLHLLFVLILSVITGVFLIAIPITIVRLIKKKKQMAQADDIIASDERILQEMRDYFAYTQTMEKNKGIDLARLVAQGSELYDNTYARAVLDKGEKEAQADLRQSVVTIGKNGEIIRNFNKRTRRGRAA